MPQTANEELRDLLIAQQVRLLRLSKRHQREVIRILERSLREANRELRLRLFQIQVLGVDKGPVVTAQVRQTIRVLGAILEGAYKEAGEVNNQLLLDLARNQSAATGRAITGSLPTGLSITLSIPSEQLLREIASRVAIQGGPLGAYFAKTGKRSLWKRTLLKYRREIEDAVASGLLGKSVDQVALSIGRSVRRLAHWQLRSVVDAATKQVSQQARLAFLAENAGDDGVVKGYQWLSTLDLHTTKEYCIPRDGKVYDVDFQPQGHGYEWGAGPGSIHWGCRSTSTAVLKSWEELGIDADEITGSQRASMDGQIAADTTAQKWYTSRKWTEGELEDVFGKRKAQRILAGDLTVGGALRGYGVRVAG